jgi:hypothetical protein
MRQASLMRSSTPVRCNSPVFWCARFFGTAGQCLLRVDPCIIKNNNQYCIEFVVCQLEDCCVLLDPDCPAHHGHTSGRAIGAMKKNCSPFAFTYSSKKRCCLSLPQKAFGIYKEEIFLDKLIVDAFPATSAASPHKLLIIKRKRKHHIIGRSESTRKQTSYIALSG